MLRNRYLILRLLGALLVAPFVAGCATPFIAPAAREVSRERLLEISEAGTSDHLHYVGSDGQFHYVDDTRKGTKKSYKVRADSMKLADTFALGKDSYVLHPWVIEGKMMGSKPEK